MLHLRVNFLCSANGGSIRAPVARLHLAPYARGNNIGRTREHRAAAWRENDAVIGDDSDVLMTAASWRRAGRGVAIATVVTTWGSAPRPVGSQMAVADGGDWVGSVSGGCVEVAVIDEARATIASGAPRLLQYGVSDERAWAVGLPCGGRIEIYVEPLE